MHMRKSLVALAALVLVAAEAGTSFAQTSTFEITPTFGWRWGGGMTSITGIRKLETDPNISYGLSIGRRLNPMAGVDIGWMHFQGDVHAALTAGGTVDGSLKRDDILLNGTWYAYRGTSTAPFFTAGAGVSIFAPERAGSETRFAWDIGAGVRHDLSEKAAARLQIKWMPTWITTGSGLYCDPYYPYFCYTAGTGESYDQFEVSLGLAFTP
jgi:opacity protein-like surface antigen